MMDPAFATVIRYAAPMLAFAIALLALRARRRAISGSSAEIVGAVALIVAPVLFGVGRFVCGVGCDGAALPAMTGVQLALLSGHVGFAVWYARRFSPTSPGVAVLSGVSVLTTGCTFVFLSMIAYDAFP